MEEAEEEVEEEEEEDVDGDAEEVEEEEVVVCMYSSWSSSTNGRSHSYATRRSPWRNFRNSSKIMICRKKPNEYIELSLVGTWPDVGLEEKRSGIGRRADKSTDLPERLNERQSRAPERQQRFATPDLE